MCRPHDEVGSIVSQPSARELPGTLLCASRAPRAAARAGAAVRIAAARRARIARAKRADAGRRAEQAGMTGNAAERRGVVVVHFADEHTAAPDVFVERHASARAGRAADPAARRIARRGRVDGRRAVAGASRRDCVELSVQRRAAAIGREESEQDEAEIAVDRLRPRRGTRAASCRCRARTRVGSRAAGRPAAPPVPTHARADPGRSTARGRRRATRRRTSRPARRARGARARRAAGARVVVAIGLVSEARSKTCRVAAGARLRRRSACRTPRATNARSLSPTSATAPGNTRSAIASSRTRARVQTPVMRRHGRSRSGRSRVHEPAHGSASTFDGARHPRRSRRGRVVRPPQPRRSRARRASPVFCITIAALTFHWRASAAGRRPRRRDR